MFEHLELRTLLNATLDGSGNLTVNGSANADTILLALNGANIDVTIQPENFSQSFPVASVNAIFVNCGDNNDTATIDAGITIAASIMGEAGNDTLTGGGGNELIVAGETGLLVSEDRGALANALSQLMQSAATRRQLGDAARRHVQQWASSKVL